MGAVGVFNSWRLERNERGGTEKLLEEPNAEQLNYRFVVEVQRPYPPTIFTKPIFISPKI